MPCTHCWGFAAAQQQWVLVHVHSMYSPGAVRHARLTLSPSNENIAVFITSPDYHMRAAGGSSTVGVRQIDERDLLTRPFTPGIYSRHH